MTFLTSYMVIRESKQPIQEAEGVSHLRKLVPVFIPVSTVASVVGIDG